ncbi:MAG: VOC family protein [Candidatus Promineifilaceae bacterium]|nr:VOC family protein [Candidatus Promineifilaceae bacterium]
MLADAPVMAYVPCVDMEGAREFYGQVLGLQEMDVPEASEEMRAGGAMYLCGGGTRLLVYQRPEPTKADHTAAGWQVEDIEATVDDLVARGVAIERYDLPGVDYDERGIAASGPIRTAWFTDPEGNVLAVSQLG